jgi:hypothetical protein
MIAMSFGGSSCPLPILLFFDLRFHTAFSATYISLLCYEYWYAEAEFLRFHALFPSCSPFGPSGGQF